MIGTMAGVSDTLSGDIKGGCVSGQLRGSLARFVILDSQRRNLSRISKSVFL
jgi:hypothetical protein